MKYKIGDIIGDYKIIDRRKKFYKNGKYTFEYDLECQICNRIKTKIHTALNHNKNSHSSCGQFEKTKDKKFYNLWQGMRTRTTNPKASNAKWYHNKNIRSDDFKNFIDFYDVMYPSFLEALKTVPRNKISIDRIDYNKDYSKENCRWINIDNQQKNTSKNVKCIVSYNEISMFVPYLHDFCNNHNLNYNTIKSYCSEKRNFYYKNFHFIRVDSKM